MTQNIEERTLAATATMEGAAKAVDEIANTDKDVSTPVGSRKSFPKISREWDDESQRLQTQWQNDSATLRQDWQNERNELSTKAFGVKLWESGVSETNINQQRRWDDGHTYLPKTVPAVMDANGPNDDWIPYTADKSDTLNDVFGLKPVDLIAGVVLTPNARKQYPKLNAFGKVWELDDGDQPLTVSSFTETASEHLIITLSDASLIVANKLSSATRAWTSKNFVASGVLTHEIMTRDCDRFGIIDTVGFWQDGEGAGRWVRSASNDDVTKSGTFDIENGLIFDATGAAFLYGERVVYLEAFGTKLDGSETAVAIFNQCNQFALKSGKTITQSRGTLLIDGDLHSLVESDLSGSTFLMSTGGRVYIDDEREGYSVELSGDDVVMAEMTELNSILPLVDQTLWETWKNSFVVIESTELDLWRCNGGQWSAYNKHTVSVMGDDGKLSYTLNHTYTQKTGLKITLYKLPKSRRRFRCPQFEIASNDVGEFVTVRRSFSNVSDFAVMPSNEQFTEYKSSLGFDTAYDVKLIDPASCGLGLSNVVYYDVYLYKSCHITIDNADMFTGWKSIDGSYSRDITVKDSVIDAIDMHYGCSGISLLNSTIGGGGLKFGTGALDESVLIDGCDILHYGNSLVGMRPDYGELKGDFIIKDSTISVKGYDSPSDVVDFLSFFSLNVFSSGDLNPSQVRPLRLPRKIVVDNVTLRTKAQVYLLATNRNAGDVTTIEKDHVMPDLIDISNLTIEGAAKVMLPWKIGFHDASSRNITKIRLSNIHGSPIELDFGNGTDPDQTVFDFAAEKTTVEAVDKKVFGHERSVLKLQHGTIHRGVDTAEQSLSYKGKLDYDDLTINVIDSTQVSLVGGFKRFTNCIVDASKYKELTGTKFNFNSRARVAHGNTAIDATYSIADADPSTGAVAVIPKEGQERNFEYNETGDLVPTWVVS
ncbi:TPA: hypothetical protein NKZ51_004530 [Vibrio parahaemolyticus]|nr:hypothetical protein [Vibrio parahaemolyticus]